MAALVGPNGAGKTTLLNLTVGLAPPTAGTVTVLGGELAGSPAALDDIAFVAQDAPLYKNLPVADMLRLTRYLNRRFDDGYARERLAELGIPLKRKAGKLSGGQHAQLALTLALARRPRLLVLDEPLANLDPLARHDFMATVLAAAAAGVLIRRVVPAMAAAMAGWAGLLLATVLYLRRRYEAPLLARNSGQGAPGIAPWVISQWWTGPNGRTVTSENQMIELLNKPQRGYAEWTVYQPAARYWHFQLIEGGWLLALALLLIAATIWLVRRRAA